MVWIFPHPNLVAEISCSKKQWSGRGSRIDALCESACQPAVKPLEAACRQALCPSLAAAGGPALSHRLWDCSNTMNSERFGTRRCNSRHDTLYKNSPEPHLNESTGFPEPMRDGPRHHQKCASQKVHLCSTPNPTSAFWSKISQQLK